MHIKLARREFSPAGKELNDKLKLFPRGPWEEIVSAAFDNGGLKYKEIVNLFEGLHPRMMQFASLLYE